MPQRSLIEMTRRQSVRFGLTAATMTFSGTPLAAQRPNNRTPADEAAPQLEFLMEVALDVPGGKNTHAVGFPGGERMTVAVTGGTFEGPKLKGVALTPAGDWLVRRPDGSSVLDVRTTLQTDDEQLIYLSYRGIMYTPEGGKLYWRTIPMFETGASKYAWLNHIVCVGTGIPAPGKAVYRIFQVL